MDHRFLCYCNINCHVRGKSTSNESLSREINVTFTLHFLRLSEHIPLEIRVRLAKIAKRTGHTVRNIKVKL